MKDGRGREIVLRLAGRRRRVQRELQARRDGQAGPGLSDALRTLNPRLIYVSHKGFLPGPLRAPHRAGRSGADDGRPGLHDRAGGPAAARGDQRQRHHGRHVRRHRRAGRAAQREPAAPGSARRCRARCSRTTSCWWPAHDAVRGDRPGGGADAQPHQAWACTTCSPSGTASRSSWPRSATPNGRCCAKSSASPICWRRPPGVQQRPGARPRVAAARAARAIRGIRRRRSDESASNGVGCPTRRSRGPRSCSTTRTCSPPAAWRRSRCPRTMQRCRSRDRDTHRAAAAHAGRRASAARAARTARAGRGYAQPAARVSTWVGSKLKTSVPAR
jgi:hypothetical protein